MNKKLASLKKLEGTISKVGEDHNIPADKMEDMVHHFFKTMHGYLTDPRMPNIKITNLGTFKPKLTRINYQIYRSINACRNIQNNPDRTEKDLKYVDKMHAKIRRLWKIRRRLMQEKNGINTWKKWQKLNPKVLEQPGNI